MLVPLTVLCMVLFHCTLCFFGGCKLLKSVAERIAMLPCSWVPPESRPARHLDSKRAQLPQDHMGMERSGKWDNAKMHSITIMYSLFVSRCAQVYNTLLLGY